MLLSAALPPAPCLARSGSPPTDKKTGRDLECPPGSHCGAADSVWHTTKPAASSSPDHRVTAGTHLGPRYVGWCTGRQGGCCAVLRPCVRSASHLSPALPMGPAPRPLQHLPTAPPVWKRAWGGRGAGLASQSGTPTSAGAPARTAQAHKGPSPDTALLGTGSKGGPPGSRRHKVWSPGADWTNQGPASDHAVVVGLSPL